MGLNVPHAELEQFLKQYDLDRDLKLSYSEFSQPFIPGDDKEVRGNLSRRVSNGEVPHPKRYNCFIKGTVKVYLEFWTFLFNYLKEKKSALHFIKSNEVTKQ